jgi:hypothetical protein
MMMAAEIQRSVAELWVVSQRTIEHTLQIDLKMPSLVVAMKPLPMEKINKKVQKTLKFPMTYQHFTAEDWARSHIQTSRCQVHQGQGAEVRGRQQVQKQVHCEDHQAPRQCHGLGMFFGSFGHGGLYFLPKNTTMNGERY